MTDWFHSRRDRGTIERELRLLATVRKAYRERGGALPSMNQVDALLDELLDLGPIDLETRPRAGRWAWMADSAQTPT